jgi:ABC-type transport system involved in multi-copper enzyme maturation permease subunit
MSAAQASRPGTLKVALAVARVTFLEIIRDKVLYNIILCAVLLLGLGYLAARLSFVRPTRLMLDFGITGVAISCAMIAIFTGATLIGREFDRRTIFVALSRPISRFQFILGKFLGLSGVLVVNWIGIAVVLVGGIWLSAISGFDGALSSTFFLALELALAQSLILAAMSIFFSAFTTTSLSVIFTIGLYLVGTNISQLRLLAARADSPVVAAVLNALSSVLPNFEHFSVGTKLSYGLPLDPSKFIYTQSYALALVALFMVAAGLLVQKRES